LHLAIQRNVGIECLFRFPCTAVIRFRCFDLPILFFTHTGNVSKKKRRDPIYIAFFPSFLLIRQYIRRSICAVSRGATTSSKFLRPLPCLLGVCLVVPYIYYCFFFVCLFCVCVCLSLFILCLLYVERHRGLALCLSTRHCLCLQRPGPVGFVAMQGAAAVCFSRSSLRRSPCSLFRFRPLYFHPSSNDM
jgi:hypothetical protein